MLKKPITYTDYDGKERTENFYFNLSKADLYEMEASVNGGLQKTIERITETEDTKKAMELFKDIIKRSYGEKSMDGKRFIKSDELSEGFMQTEAYSELLVELVTKEDAAANFINGIIPAKIAEQIAENTHDATVSGFKESNSQPVLNSPQISTIPTA